LKESLLPRSGNKAGAGGGPDPNSGITLTDGKKGEAKKRENERLKEKKEGKNPIGETTKSLTKSTNEKESSIYPKS